MATLKPEGMQIKEYKEAQARKAEDDFKFQTNQRIQNLQFAIEMINKSLSQTIANEGSLESQCKAEVNELMNVQMTLSKEFRQTLIDMQTDVTFLERAIMKMQHSLNERIEISVFNETISDLNEEIESLQRDRDSMRKEFNGMIQRLKIDFDAKLKAQKEEILAIPSEIPNLRKVMDQKIELVELNGQNAVLRSSNNEKQIMLVERKIDNLYQLLKEVQMRGKE